MIDFGLVILAWLVQLVVYPGLAEYSTDDMKRWHPSYSMRISMLVMPLMLGQLALHAFLLFLHIDWVTVSTALLVIATWLSTFLQAVPLHNAVENASDTRAVALQLVSVNKLRTILWTIIFGLVFFHFY